MIFGRAGDDRLAGRAGDDFLSGGDGSDRVAGDSGNDRVSLQGDGFDTVGCGSGVDVVTADRADAVAPDCEVVTRELSRDVYRNADAQHEAQVEPDSFSHGRTVVTAFQTGRFSSGGATDIGFATSRDAGSTWRSGFLPGVSVFSHPAGASGRVTDPAVGYDAAHHVWLVASLGGAEGVTADGDDRLLVSRSADGLAWGRPVTAARAREAYDKPWIACDNWAGSRFRGRCYLTYLDVPAEAIMTLRSSDGGLTWSDPVTAAAARPATFPNGAVPIIRPGGTLVVLFSSFAAIPSPEDDHIGSVRSRDGGVTFLPETVVSQIAQSTLLGVRAVTFLSAESDSSGRIYAVWQDCRFDGCESSGIAFSSSPDGLAWSEAREIPTGRSDPGTNLFLPAVGVDPGHGGGAARLTVVYHSLPPCHPSFCLGVNVAVVSSRNGGVTWTAPRRLTSEAMPLSWIVDSDIGPMLGDYVSVSYAGGRPVPVFALASAPSAGSFHQAIFATTRGLP